MPEKPFPGEEPSADMRTAARTTRELFVAFVHEGFTEAQAMRIIGAMLAAQDPEAD